MSSTVSLGSMTISSNTESAEEMVEALTTKEEKDPKPKILADKGAKVEEEKPKEGLSKAASDLGKEGGKAAAKARKDAERDERIRKAEEARTRKPEDEPEPTDEPEEDEAAAEARELQEELDAEPDSAKRKQRAAERVTEATRKARTERLRAERLEAEVAQLRQQRQVPAPPPTPTPQEQPQVRKLTEKPDVKNYEVYEEYLDDRDRWVDEERGRKEERERFAHAHASRALQSIDAFKSRVADEIDADESLAESVIPFKDVVQNSSHVTKDEDCTAFTVVNDEILRSPIPGRLMAYLNANEEVMRGLLKLPTRDSIARKMERIQERLEGATAGPPPTKRAVSQAPPPVRPVTGSPRTADQDLDENAPMSEFIKRHGQRELKARSR